MEYKFLGSPQQITRIRRQYNQWVADETLEDYALRFTADSARRWSPFGVASTAFGGISFLACEAIGGSLTLAFGFTNTVLAIAAVSLLIFASSLPISYYAAKFGVDIDLLTRGAGFGYIGSTVTSLIYASFTFILFAVEASIMSQALNMCLGIPMWLAHVISAFLVLPIAVLGVRVISRMQIWTQPIWLLLQLAPFVYLLVGNADLTEGWTSFGGERGPSNGGFSLPHFGAAVSIILSLLPQIGEQVDYLRFLPDQRRVSKKSWWGALLVAGPGWIFVGAAKLVAGSFLAYIALRHGLSAERAVQPPELYRMVFEDLLNSPAVALAVTGIFVVICQMKINVTNAYAGSIAWSNFFSRLTHSHPGRVVWLVFNVLLALMLMEFGILNVIERILGLYANLAVAWIGALTADLVVNKPLGVSPAGIEFRRAHLYDINPVGVGAMLLSLIVSTVAHFGLMGETASALAPLIGFLIAFITAPAIAILTDGRYYIARPAEPLAADGRHLQCSICEHSFEPSDMSSCPAYGGLICSLCCSLEMRCRDRCKDSSHFSDQLKALSKAILPESITTRLGRRVGQFLSIVFFLTAITGLFLTLFYFEVSSMSGIDQDTLKFTLEWVFVGLLLVIGLSAWAFVLTHETRRLAEEETDRQTAMLFDEIEAHKRTEAALEKAKGVAEAANIAKTRFIYGLSHEIRTPLNSIYGYSQLLDRKSASDPAEAINVIRRSSEHISNLMDGLLDISKIETGSLQISRNVVDVGAFFDQLVEMFSLPAVTKGLEFHHSRSPNLPTHIYADEKRLRQILLNLLSNAVKYTERGHITLHVRYRTSLVEIEVSDTGMGIGADEMERVLQPFERGRSAVGIPGTGLGLAISKLLASLLGGDLTVKSEPGQGSTFMVRLFLSPAPAPENAGEKRRIIGYEGPRRTVLIADDDAAHRGLLKEILVPLGFEVTTTDNGTSCLEIAKLHAPDLLMLDITMSGMTGWEVSAAVRAADMKGPAILIISAEVQALTTRNRAEIHHDDYLVKPFEVSQLLERVETLLNLAWIYEGAAKKNKTREPLA